MKHRRLHRSRAARGERGFTLFEALVAVALTGLLLAMLGTVTAQWLPTWNYGFARLQRADLVALAAERIAADLASAEFLSLDPTSQRAFFDGAASSVVLVRSALGPNAADGLEIIRIAEEEEEKGFALVRSRAPFALLGPRDGGSSGIAFGDKITLLRSPFRVSFAFADATREWRDLWQGMPVLPSAVRITIADATKSKTPYAVTTASLHMSAAAVCTRTPLAFGCMEELTRRGIVSVPTEAERQRR
jgi:general secretion pathway protein J